MTKNMKTMLEEFKMNRSYHKNHSENLIKELTEYINYLEQRAYSAQTQLKEYKKDTAIEALNKKIEELRSKSLYIMTDNEQEQIDEFKDEHYTFCRSGYSYVFSGNGIGDWMTIKCLKCGEEREIVDMDSW